VVSRYSLIVEGFGIKYKRMNYCFLLILLVVVLVLYFFFFKEILVKWQERDSIQKSYSRRFTIVLVISIILMIWKLMKS